MAMVLIATICILGVAFLIRFLIALCQEDSAHSKHVVQILSHTAKTDINLEELSSIGSKVGTWQR
jgi:hypothetical protein